MPARLVSGFPFGAVDELFLDFIYERRDRCESVWII